MSSTLGHSKVGVYVFILPGFWIPFICTKPQWMFPKRYIRLSTLDFLSDLTWPPVLVISYHQVQDHPVPTGSDEMPENIMQWRPPPVLWVYKDMGNNNNYNSVPSCTTCTIAITINLDVLNAQNKKKMYVINIENADLKKQIFRFISRVMNK